MYKGGKKVLLIIGIIIGLVICPILFACTLFFSISLEDELATASVLPRTNMISGLPEDETATEDTALPYERGILTDMTFESEWIGLRFICPENLIMESQEELDLGLTDEDGNLLENTGLINELGVYNEDVSFYLAMTVEDPFSDEMTVDDYIQFIVTSFSSEPGEYTFDDSAGMRSIGALDFRKLTVSTTDEGGIPFHNDFYITCKGEKFIVISTYYSDDASHYSEQALNAFLPY